MIIIARRYLWLGLVLLVASLMLSACQDVLVPLNQQPGATEQETPDEGPALVRIATCWSALPMMEDLAAAYAARDPLLTIDVVPANSAMARDMLDAGQVDMAVVSRGVGMAPPPPWRGPTAKVLALDAVTVVVHRQSSLSAVTSAQLAALYAGDYGDWSQLGAGQGRPEVVVRDAGSALQQMFEDAVLDHRSLSSTAVVMPHDRGVIEYVASHPNAIGYISRAYVHEGVKAIPLNGVAPTPQAIQRKDYSMWYSLEALISPQAHPQAARLITFAQSGRGRQVIEDRYVLPR